MPGVRIKNASEVVSQIEQAAKAGPFTPTWDALAAYRVPQWYEDAKFGIFIHWGVYSVPAFGNEWYPRHMYLKDDPAFAHHVATYGPQSQFGYKDFIPRFRRREVRRRRLGRALQASRRPLRRARGRAPRRLPHVRLLPLPRWCAAKMGPKRDIVGELAAAVRQQGMIFGVSSHRAEHWWFMDGGMEFDSDVQRPRYARFYGPARPRSTCATMPTPRSSPISRTSTTGWRAPASWSTSTGRSSSGSTGGSSSRPSALPADVRRLLLQPRRGMGARRGHQLQERGLPRGTAVYDIERGQLTGIRPAVLADRHLRLQELLGLRRRAGLQDRRHRSWTTWWTSSARTARCCSTSARGRTARSREPEQEMLLEIGALAGASTARPSTARGRGRSSARGRPRSLEGRLHRHQAAGLHRQDIRFTTKGDMLYATLLGWPESGEAQILSLGTASGLHPAAVSNVTMLGSAAPLTWSRDGKALHVKLPVQKPGSHAFVLKIT